MGATVCRLYVVHFAIILDDSQIMEAIIPWCESLKLVGHAGI